jgi:hypothetical protein
VTEYLAPNNMVFCRQPFILWPQFAKSIGECQAP